MFNAKSVPKTRLAKVDVLLAVLVSVTVLATLAAFVTVVPASEASTRTVKVTVTPPSAKLAVVATRPVGEMFRLSAFAGCTLALSKVKPAGKMSVTVRLVATVGPAFKTCKV